LEKIILEADPILNEITEILNNFEAISKLTAANRD
jgi:hypothetical protein